MRKAHTDLHAALAEVEAAKKSVQDSKPFKDRLAALRAPTQSQQSDLLRSALQDDTAYSAAQSRLTKARTTWSESASVLDGSEEWKEANRALRGSAGRAEESRRRGPVGSFGRKPAAARLQEAREAAAEAQATVTACEHRLRAMGVTPGRRRSRRTAVRTSRPWARCHWHPASAPPARRLLAAHSQRHPESERALTGSSKCKPLTKEHGQMPVAPEDTARTGHLLGGQPVADAGLGQ